MTLSAHAAAGMAVGLATKNPVLGFFVGIFSHFVLDVIPHTDLGSLGGNISSFQQIKSWKPIIFGDLALAMALFLLVFYKTDFLPAVFWGAAGAILPDIIDNNPYWSPNLRKVFPTNYFHAIHEAIHFTIEKRKYFWVGIVTQIIIIIISLTFIFNLLI